MGYETCMNGSLKVTPPMTADDFGAFQKLAAYYTPKDADSAVQSLRDQMSGTNAEIDLLLGGDDTDASVPHELNIAGRDYNWHFQEGLDFVIENFFAPRGYVVNGELDWDGDDPGDSGTVYVKDNKVEWVKDDISNRGPSWRRQPTAAELAELLHRLLSTVAPHSDISSLPIFDEASRAAKAIREPAVAA